MNHFVHGRCHHFLLGASLLALLAASAQAWADDGALARCRAIADPAARLACYDAIPLTAAARPPIAAPAPAAPAPAIPVAPAAPATAAPAAAAQAAAPQHAPVPVEERVLAPAAKKAESFGLENQRPKDELQEIVSRIDGTFDGWVPNQRIRLANGQVWQIADGSTSWFTAVSPRVTIWRGLFGAFYMTVDGRNQSPRVQRVQ